MLNILKDVNPLVIGVLALCVVSVIGIVFLVKKSSDTKYLP